MRKRYALFAAMALSGLALIGLTVSAGQSSAVFTATTTSAANQFATASLVISTDKPGTVAANTLVIVSNLVPGDTAQRAVVVTNSGGTAFTYAVASTLVAPSTLLWSDSANGLQVTAYRCGCTLAANQVYSGALSALSIPASGTIAAAGSETLTFVFSLPATADNTFQNLTQGFSLTYTATQLAGTAR